MLTQAQSEFMKAIDEVDIEGVKRDLKSVDDLARVDISYDPATAMRGRFVAPGAGVEEGGGLVAKSQEPARPAYASPEMEQYLGNLSDAEYPARESSVASDATCALQETGTVAAGRTDI
jgi:hypothetical protein